MLSFIASLPSRQLQHPRPLNSHPRRLRPPSTSHYPPRCCYITDSARTTANSTNDLLHSSPDEDETRVLDSVLKLYCVHRHPDYALPWSMSSQKHSTSTAFITPDRYIITNAHSVEHHVSVRLKKRADDRKFNANVVAVANECDIALLEIVPEEAEDFWFDFEAGLQAGPLPQLQDTVLVVGYPSPGEMLSVTKGVCSRVEMQHYSYGQGHLLAVQIDAAINPGNSGGPVFNDRQHVIGIAFQSVDPSQADSVGYFIPYSVVQHFLDDITANGRYTGFPFAGFHWQRLESKHLRDALQLPPSRSGVLVKWVAETTDAARVIQRGDIITHLDGVAVSNAGTIPFRAGERIGFEFLITSKFTNQQINVTLLRNGVQHYKTYRLPAMLQHRLVPVHDSIHDKRKQPQYVIFGGLVFQALSEPFLSTFFGSNWLNDAPVKLIDEYFFGTCTNDGRREVVVLSQLLSTACTAGYEEEFSSVVVLDKINGQFVNSVEHVAELIDEAASVDVRFEFHNDGIIIINASEAEAEEEHMLNVHCIPELRSPLSRNESQSTDVAAASSTSRPFPSSSFPSSPPTSVPAAATRIVSASQRSVPTEDTIK